MNIYGIYCMYLDVHSHVPCACTWGWQRKVPDVLLSFSTLFSWDNISHWTQNSPFLARFAGQKATVFLLFLLPPPIELQVYVWPCLVFYMGPGEPHSGSHISRQTIFPSKLSPFPIFLILTHVFGFIICGHIREFVGVSSGTDKAMWHVKKSKEATQLMVKRMTPFLMLIQ